MTRKLIPPAVKSTIEEYALEFIDGAYRNFSATGGKEPCVTVGLMTDFCRQAFMPDDFKWATKKRQLTWVRSTLESMRRRGQVSSSRGVHGRCYEPGIPATKKTPTQLDAEISKAVHHMSRRHGDYVYRNASDAVRIRIFRRDKAAWDFDVFLRGGGFENYTSEFAESPLPTKAAALAVARDLHGPLHAISVGSRVTAGW